MSFSSSASSHQGELLPNKQGQNVLRHQNSSLLSRGSSQYDPILCSSDHNELCSSSFPRQRPYRQPSCDEDNKLNQDYPRNWGSVVSSSPNEIMTSEMKATKPDRKRLVKNRQRSETCGSGGPQTKYKRAQKEKGLGQNRVARLEKPLSELTKNCNGAPLVDIEGYVNRSIEVRRKEVSEGKEPGKVKRPMNSFMLYRKAYQHRTKLWCDKNNHQVVSQVCGDSWPLEPDFVKRQFSEWAQIERHNHQMAHPGYKFSPSKPGTVKMSKRRSSTALITDDSDSEDPNFKNSSFKKQRGVNDSDIIDDFATPQFSHESLSQYVSSPQSINSMTQQDSQGICYQERNKSKQLPRSFELGAALQAEDYHQDIPSNHETSEEQDVFLASLRTTERFVFEIPERELSENGLMEFPDSNMPCSLSGHISNQPMISLNQMCLTGSYLADHFSQNEYFQGQECQSKGSLWQSQFFGFQHEVPSIVNSGLNPESYKTKNFPSHVFRGQADEFSSDDFLKWPHFILLIICWEYDNCIDKCVPFLSCNRKEWSEELI